MARTRLSSIVTLLALGALALAPAAAMAAGQYVGLAQSRAVVQPEAMARSSSLVASTSECPGQNSLSAPASTQEQAMRCMTDYARTRAGLAPLADAPDLDASATAKAADLVGCDSFSHYACGRDFTYWMREVGYISPDTCWHAGENLAWGAESYGTVRSIFQAWMRSPSHRRNILGEYSELGVSLAVGGLQGIPDAHVWAQHFGSRCAAEPQAG